MNSVSWRVARRKRVLALLTATALSATCLIPATQAQTPRRLPVRLGSSQAAPKAARSGPESGTGASPAAQAQPAAPAAGAPAAGGQPGRPGSADLCALDQILPEGSDTAPSSFASHGKMDASSPVSR